MLARFSYTSFNNRQGNNMANIKIIKYSKLCRHLDNFLCHIDLYRPLMNFCDVLLCHFSEKFEKNKILLLRRNYATDCQRAQSALKKYQVRARKKLEYHGNVLLSSKVVFSQRVDGTS